MACHNIFIWLKSSGNVLKIVSAALKPVLTMSYISNNVWIFYMRNDGIPPLGGGALCSKELVIIALYNLS